jgi:hypothetical protein
LQGWIDSHTVSDADANRLYVFFVQPNVVVDATALASVGSTTQQNVLGYNPTVYVDGYAVQRIADRNDQAMTPPDATSDRPVTFVLENVVIGVGWRYAWFTNELFEKSADGMQPVTWSDGAKVLGVSSISDQGIDNHGHAVIDVVLRDGTAWEIHDGNYTVQVGENVKDANAGQGVSYLLYTNGNVSEYRDAVANWVPIDSGVSAIDAGTDRTGVNMVTELWNGQAWEWSDSSGWHYIPYSVYSVTQISAGRQGMIDFVDAAGQAFLWIESSGQFVYLGSGVTRVTTGYDQYGGLVVDLLYWNGDLWDWRAATGWQRLDWDVYTVSKARAGVVDDISNLGTAWEFDAWDNFSLLSSSNPSQVA